MKKTTILLLAGLLLAAPATPLSANPSALATCMADETLSEATAMQVLEQAAPLIGQEAESLYAEYRDGRVLIEDLGPISGGHRYRVTKAGAYDFVIDILVNG